ncbi:MAG: 3-methyladenine DNA glycosylase [Chloroflexi bacterium HGW-Chloroflexi-1]|nr:MAG: 3-methyladenine DNA glycosylase [Chloroflexi bacterium HGW-Chloroflexi-1]
MTHLPRSFFQRDTLAVARALLGQRLVRVFEGERLSGLICEVEAYRGADDRASHAYRRTPRSAIMYGPPGHAYVYFIYGMYFCLNAVTEAAERPGAVLIRAILPQEGLPILCDRRPGIPDRHLTDGPGKLCQALGVTLALNGVDLTTSAELFIEAAEPIPADEIVATPRVGVRGDEAARRRPWRFLWPPIADTGT